MTHSYVWHGSCICVTWLILICGMTQLCVWHDPFMCDSRALPLMCGPWLVHMCDMTHSYVGHDSFMCVTWLIRVWHDSFMCVTWLIRTCDMTHSYAYRDTTWLITYKNDVLYIWSVISICTWDDASCISPVISQHDMTFHIQKWLTIYNICRWHDASCVWPVISRHDMTYHIQKWRIIDMMNVAVCCSVLQCVAVCCSLITYRNDVL